MSQIVDRVVSAALSMSLSPLKPSETELDTRIATLARSLGSQFGEKFQAGIRALWMSFYPQATIPISAIDEKFPDWELSKKGYNIFQAWSCSLELITPSTSGLGEIFQVTDAEVDQFVQDKGTSTSPCALVQFLAAHFGYTITIFRIRSSDDVDFTRQLVTEVIFDGLGAEKSQGEAVIAVSDTRLYRIFSAGVPVDLQNSFAEVYCCLHYNFSIVLAESKHIRG